MRDDYKHSHAYGSSDQVQDFQVEVSLKLQEGLLKKSFIFDPDDKIWFAKIQVIHELAKGVKDVFNYGFYELPNNGRAGKFLDEERTFKDYPQRGSPVELEFKYKRRVYKSLQYDSKTLQKVHTKSNLKKLLECVSSNNVAQVSKWTEKGLDPNFQDDKSGETPLTIAVTSDDRRDLIAMLVNGGAHLDYRAGDGLTPMHKAALAGKASNVKILLDLGCPPNVKDPKGLTPLYYSVLHGGDPYCTELLLNEHAQMGVADHQGMQEVHHACKKGLVQHLEHLVFYGANIDATTASGNTPLHITALSNHEECARVLLFRGARRDILNYANQSAYEVAAVAGNKELAEFIRRFSDGQIVKFTEKPTYSTRRRKVVPKPRAQSLFEYRSSSLDTHSHSSKSDSSLPPSPRSLSGSHRSNSNAGSLDENGPHNGRIQRSTSICSTASESSYTSDPEDLTLNERRFRAQENRTRDVEYPSGKMAPPVKIVSGAASVRKRLYAANAAGRRYIAVKDYVPCRSGELQLERGDIVEVLYVGERGFWEGRVEDRTGWFPSVCIEELKKGEKQRPRTLFGRPPSFSSMFAKAEDPRAPAIPDRRFIQQPREVILNRGKSGFGFQMRGANCQTPRLNFRPTKDFPALQYIGEVEPGGEADIKGVKNDDFIIEVNYEDVTTATHSHVVNLIKRSGNSVKLKIVTVPVSIVNGVDTLDYTDAGHRGKVPPPLPQRDPSTTLTLGRMRTSSRPSLFDAGLVHSHEEPASFKVDSVIAVSKDSQWSTLQRRKPSDSSSRSAAQFKFNSGSRSKLRNRDGEMTLDQRSRSMQNIASLSTPYDSATVGRAPRPRSTAVPFAIPQVPERFTRSMSHGEDTLSKPRDFHAYSDPSLLDKPSLPTRSLSVDESRYNMSYETNSTNFNDEETIVATPVSTSVTYVEDTRSNVDARPIDSTYIQAANGDVNRQRKHSLGSNDSLGQTLQRAVEARNERINEQNRTDRKISAPASVTSQRRRAHTAAERLRSDIMSQLKTQLNTDNNVSSNVDSRSDSIEIGYQGNTSGTDYSRNSVTDQGQGDAIDNIAHTNTADTRFHGNAIDTGYHGNSVDVSYHRNTDDTNYHGNVIDTSYHSKVSRRPSSESQASSPSKNKDSPKKLAKPPISKKPAPPPPPPPVPPTAPPLPVTSTVKPSKPATKGKKFDIPQTAVRQGLITVDALQAKKGKLKAIKNSDQDCTKNSNSIHAMVGQLAGQGGRAGAKPAPAFGGNQHAHMLARAVAARAAKLANEASDNEHDSPSSWEDDTSSPNIPRTSPLKTTQTIPKKTPPPVAPKKTSGRRSLFPPKMGDPDRPYDYSTEEDRTMMIFDDVIRKEVESENWSLNSWNSSDSSSLAEGVLPPGTYLSNSIDDRPRKSSFGSGSRPWYEYSSGSPSEESLNASSERISQLRPSISLDEGTAGNRNRINDIYRRYSDEDGRSVSSTLTRDSEINLVPVSEKRSHSVSNSSIGSDEISNDVYAIDNCLSSDDLNERYTPTNNIIPGNSTVSHSASDDSDVVEKTITTQSGIKIKLLLNKSPSKDEPRIPSQPCSPKDINRATSFNDSDKSPMSNHLDEELSDFLPPPPTDFTCQDIDNMPSPPLPPPPEFLPIDNNDFNSPLPAPPIDFCDDDTDPGSLLDVPAISNKQVNSGSTFRDKALLEWNSDDVCDWLDSLNLSQYQDTFRENDIKGLHLPELTKADLLELGIKSLGHRITMENSVAKLCQPVESSC